MGDGIPSNSKYDCWQIRGLSSTLFGRQDELVVLVTERLEGGPVSSRVSTFQMSQHGGGWTEMHGG